MPGREVTVPRVIVLGMLAPLVFLYSIYADREDFLDADPHCPRQWGKCFADERR
jgi:hypothetical protein